MKPPLVLVVSLWVAHDRIAEYMEYERKVSRIMAGYGGHIERVIRLDAASDDLDWPYEIHIAQFPDELAFSRYREDPEVLSLARTREQVILRTSVLAGRDMAPYEP